MNHPKFRFHRRYDEQDEELLVAEKEAELENNSVGSSVYLSKAEYSLKDPNFMELEPVMLDKLLLEHKKRSLLATYLTTPSN